MSLFGVSLFLPWSAAQAPHGVERAMMAEIKSTLELALERTKSVSISKEEKDEIKRKEMAQKATGLFHRYMEESLSMSELMREIERLEEKARPMVRDALLFRWVAAISLEAENEKLLRGIESLKGRSVDEMKQRLKDLRSEYERRELEAKQEMEIQRVETLRKEGIHGSALVPHVKGCREWEEKMISIAQGFEGEIEKVREALRRL